MRPSVLLPTQSSLLVSRNSPFIHRDLSWLQFNDRVLQQARSSSNPLLERVKFLAITAANLDEFFMIRISSIHRAILTAKRKDPAKQAQLIRIRDNLLDGILKFTKRQTDTLDSIANALKAHRIYIVRKEKEDHPSFEIGKKIFAESILPYISAPEKFSPQQISALENLQIAVILDANMWVKIPKTIPSVFLSDLTKQGELYAYFIDDLLMTHLGPTFALKSPPQIIRLTRDADVQVDLEKEDAESIPDIVQRSLGIRDKGRPVRLQYLGNLADAFKHKLAHHLKLSAKQIHAAPSSLVLNGLWSLVVLAPGKEVELRAPSFQPYRTQAFKDPASIFERLKQRDFLLHHPYDSFQNFVVWMKAAASDPQVESIELTVYRVDALSPVIDALKLAAKTKTVRVMIELRARFDEQNNLKLAEDLRKAGVQVGFGFGKLKLHAKVALVTRKEGDGLVHYTHLSTGNYNAMTAQVYTDLALLTAHPEIGHDARYFFDQIFKGEIPTQFKQLVSAPTRLHKRLLGLILDETAAAKAGRKARIVAKVNALVDDQVVQSLYDASIAGVEIDLIVRGACSLVPGVKGLSENIRVMSLVDKYLEHSRIYYFSDSKALYLSSADWMPRNFFSRLELAFPVLDRRIYEYIESVVIPIYLADSAKARELTAGGIWKKKSQSKLPEALEKNPIYEKRPIRAQDIFEALATSRYSNTIMSFKNSHS